VRRSGKSTPSRLRACDSSVVGGGLARMNTSGSAHVAQRREDDCVGPVLRKNSRGDVFQTVMKGSVIRGPRQVRIAEVRHRPFGAGHPRHRIHPSQGVHRIGSSPELLDITGSSRPDSWPMEPALSVIFRSNASLAVPLPKSPRPLGDAAETDVAAVAACYFERSEPTSTTRRLIPGACDSRRSQVSRTASSTSASATYTASYAVRF
jgi:hypothetical protein